MPPLNDIFSTIFTFLLSANLGILVALYNKVNNLSIDVAKIIQKIGGIE